MSRGLADCIGVTPNTILRYEAGEIEPSGENVEKIADCLRFPKAFFDGDEIDEPRRDNASFRGMASKSDRIMDAALASGAIAFLLDDWIAKSFNRPEPDLLDLQGVAPADCRHVVAPALAIGRQAHRQHDLSTRDQRDLRVFAG